MLVYCRVTPDIKFACINPYTWVERGPVRHCLAQEHNTTSPVRARARTAWYGVERTNHKATASPSNDEFSSHAPYNNIQIGNCT